LVVSDALARFAIPVDYSALAFARKGLGGLAWLARWVSLDESLRVGSLAAGGCISDCGSLFLIGWLASFGSLACRGGCYFWLAHARWLAQFIRLASIYRVALVQWLAWLGWVTTPFWLAPINGWLKITAVALALW